MSASIAFYRKRSSIKIVALVSTFSVLTVRPGVSEEDV